MVKNNPKAERGSFSRSVPKRSSSRVAALNKQRKADLPKSGSDSRLIIHILKMLSLKYVGKVIFAA